MRVLVMGGTQFNGLALVHDLANTGHQVVILNRGKSEAKLPLGVERVYADRTKPDQMREVLRSVDVDAVIEARGLKQMDDSGALEAIVDAVLKANEKSVAEYRAGKDKAFNALVGQVMKASAGKANPAQAGELLRRKLG